MYKVFEVDVCFDDYAMEDRLVGAESKEDLIEHLEDTFSYLGKRKIKKIIKEAEYRITEVENLFTDKPYVSLSCHAYME